MWISMFLMSSILHITAGNEGCTLSGTNHPQQQITAFTGQSVLLPCSCTVRQFTPPRLTWTKHTSNQETVILTQSDLYSDRMELFNEKLPGNLSVLLSNLTQDDQGDYRCTTKDGENRDIDREIRLNVKGCALSGSTQLNIVSFLGQSVLLPCSCTELQAKPQKLTWTKLHDRQTISLSQSELYRGRVKMFNTEDSPGNLSVLLSCITKEDHGWYRCTINNQNIRDIFITVQGTDGTQKTTTTKQPKVTQTNRPETTKALPTTASKGTNTVGISGEATSASFLQNIIQSPLLAVLPVILIIAGVALYIYKRNKEKKNKGENSIGSKTGREKNNETETLVKATYTTPLSAPDDPTAMYATIKHRNVNHEETTSISAPEAPSVIYSTIVHMTGKGKAAVSLENSGETEYASIKTGISS